MSKYLVAFFLFIFFNDDSVRSQTNIDLPACLPDLQCNRTELFRSFDGTCNNLANPQWGAVGAAYLRSIGPDFGNGKDSPRGDGAVPPLPLPRDIVSTLTEGPDPSPSTVVTEMTMAWGQVVSHDMMRTLSASVDFCCDDGQTSSSSDPECLPIDVSGDEFYSTFNVTCLEFVRSRSADPNCTIGEGRRPFNIITSFIDASLLYGTSVEENLNLRTELDGMMKIRDNDFENTAPKQCTSACPFSFLPSRINTNGQETFLAGDARAHQQPALVSLHTLLLRFHNDIAIRLANKYNFDDEFIFQVTRRIVIAVEQHITYNEFLPVVLGRNIAESFGLLPLNFGYIPCSKYEYETNPTLEDAFSAAAYRFGHSLVANFIQTGSGGNSINLAESFLSFIIPLTQGTYPSDIMEGLSFQRAEIMDHILPQSLRNLLFARSNPFGSDLYSTNIKRGRDHGIPAYNEWREFCGLPRITNFSELSSVMRSDPAVDFSTLYNDVDDIDLYPAGLSELPVNGGIVGPTFACIIAEQFRDLKYGDRFFYEMEVQPEPFSFIQLQLIRRTFLSSLLCMYTDVEKIQKRVLEVIGGGNDLEKCHKHLKKNVLSDVERFF